MSQYSLTINVETLEELDRHVHTHAAYSALDEVRQQLRKINKYGEEMSFEQFAEFFYSTLNVLEIGHLVP